MYTIKPDYVKIGQCLREARKKSGLSQRAAAKELGFSFQLISQIENGRSRAPIEKFSRMCELYGLSFFIEVFDPKIKRQRVGRELLGIIPDMTDDAIDTLDALLNIWGAKRIPAKAQPGDRAEPLKLVSDKD